MTPITNIAFLLSALACVSAHGFIPSITIAGKEYKGNQIGSNNMDSVIRSVTAQDPMYGATNKGLSCGPGSKPAKLTADASPGDEIEFAWTAADGSNVCVSDHPCIQHDCSRSILSGLITLALCRPTWRSVTANARMLIQTLLSGSRLTRKVSTTGNGLNRT